MEREKMQLETVGTVKSLKNKEIWNESQGKTATIGITLVALVVTIVVLLILAGITLVYVFGDNGIFKEASEAKLKTDIANWQERLEVAKGPIFIEGLGTFDPDDYFQYIQDQGIINSKERDIIDNGDGTYDVTTKSGYVFLVTLIPDKEKTTDVEVEYLGQTGKLLPKIKGIKVTSKKTSMNIQVLARLEGGEVKCYYKKANEVVSGEDENSIEGYIEVILDGNLAGSITGLIAGESYKIKAVLQKDGEDIGGVAIEEKTLQPNPVESITLSKTSAIIYELGTTVQLIATIKPDEADDKTVTWSSSNPNIATVDQNGLITKKEVGETVITVTANDGSNVLASCNVTVSDETDWELMNKIAKAIANDSSITSGSAQAPATIDGESKTIRVGDIYKVKYNGELKRVRVLGFKHDDLVDQGVYKDGKKHEKAGISFEFLDLMTGASYMAMNSSATNSEGWVSTKMRSDLNGSGSSIGGLGDKLSNKAYIKQVKKIYNPTYSASSTSSTSNDYLWLLSCSEIWTSGATSGANYGHGKAKEGEQYQYYKGVVTGTESNPNLKKTQGAWSNVGQDWWLRSPHYYSIYSFCYVTSGGSSNYSAASGGYGVAPGFCI